MIEGVTHQRGIVQKRLDVDARLSQEVEPGLAQFGRQW